MRSDYVSELSAAFTPTHTPIYKRVGGRELLLHIFEPSRDSLADAKPCLLIVHGGGWVNGSPQRMYGFVEHFSRLGGVGISMEYRRVDPAAKVSVFDCVRDGRTAMRYLRTHADELGIDPRRIAVAGASAGGHIAAGTAMFDGLDECDEKADVSCAPDALVLYFPVLDTSADGFGKERIGPRWRDISPLHQVRPGIPPTIVFHGTEDTVTPFRGSQDFQKAMIAAGNRCELVAHEGGEHGYLRLERALYEDALRRTDTFLESLGILDARNLGNVTKIGRAAPPNESLVK